MSGSPQPNRPPGPDETGGERSEVNTDVVVQQHLGLVGSVARRFAGLGYEHDDLFQIGCIGLIKAAERFDPSYGVRFSTYAVPLILGEIRRFLRDDGPIKVSRGTQQLARMARQTEEQLRSNLGRDVSAVEVAAALDRPLDEVIAARDAQRPPISLQEPAAYEGGEVTLEERLGSESPIPATEDRLALQTALAALAPRERALIVHRFFHNKTQAAVAVELGISQVHVSRLERKALAQLRLMLSG